MKVKLAIKMRALAEKSYDKNTKGVIIYIERLIKYNAKRGLREYVYYIDDNERTSINWDCIEKHFERQGFKIDYVGETLGRKMGLKVKW